ncbi:hypothetical protein [Verrucomicrobium spinosum]|uniref:hypothetical protein n=1 Tax=Verrucomicrobium spinosum TaxID=2736 RepID=UPI0009463FAE|nr:hypothetical protein [Verrucomicrobium spinosum]
METKKPARQKARRRESGAALIMTLFIVGVLTILVVGFLSTMQTERQAAGAYESSQRTKLVAQGP